MHETNYAELKFIRNVIPTSHVSCLLKRASLIHVFLWQLRDMIHSFSRTKIAFLEKKVVYSKKAHDELGNRRITFVNSNIENCGERGWKPEFPSFRNCSAIPRERHRRHWRNGEWPRWRNRVFIKTQTNSMRPSYRLTRALLSRSVSFFLFLPSSLHVAPYRTNSV